MSIVSAPGLKINHNKVGKKVLPSYAYYYINKFNLNQKIMERLSLWESSHFKKKHTNKRYWGRYMIGKDTLKDYCKLADIKFPEKWRSYLLDDINNCFITYYLCSNFLARGYSYKEFVQRWLFGEEGIRSGRWSYSYENKIFR